MMNSDNGSASLRWRGTPLGVLLRDLRIGGPEISAWKCAAGGTRELACSEFSTTQPQAPLERALRLLPSATEAPASR